MIHLLARCCFETRFPKYYFPLLNIISFTKPTNLLPCTYQITKWAYTREIIKLQIRRTAVEDNWLQFRKHKGSTSKDLSDQNYYEAICYIRQYCQGSKQLTFRQMTLFSHQLGQLVWIVQIWSLKQHQMLGSLSVNTILSPCAVWLILNYEWQDHLR